MGTLLGHLVPGTFFMTFAIWWGFCLPIKYYRGKYASKLYIYRSTTAFSCFCCSSGRTAPVESYLKVIAAFLGMLGEIVTGFARVQNDQMHRDVLIFGENNAQHVTMFLGFGLAAVLEILVHYEYRLPSGIDFVANIFAYGIEGFLFHFHLHGRSDVDIHVHTLLVYTIVFCMFAAIWEYNRPEQILATYARIAGTFLQGVWFYAIGFILYFPSSDPYWTWSSSHGHVLLITAIYIWMMLSVCLFLFIQSFIVRSFLQRSSHSKDDQLELHSYSH